MEGSVSMSRRFCRGGPIASFSADTLEVPGASLYHEIRGDGAAMAVVTATAWRPLASIKSSHGN